MKTVIAVRRTFECHRHAPCRSRSTVFHVASDTLTVSQTGMTDVHRTSVRIRASVRRRVTGFAATRSFIVHRALHAYGGFRTGIRRGFCLADRCSAEVRTIGIGRTGFALAGNASRSRGVLAIGRAQALDTDILGGVAKRCCTMTIRITSTLDAGIRRRVTGGSCTRAIRITSALDAKIRGCVARGGRRRAINTAHALYTGIRRQVAHGGRHRAVVV